MALILIFTILAFAGCSTSSASTLTPSNDQSSNNFDTSKNISVVSREDGSGTRGAFIKLFSIPVKTEI